MPELLEVASYRALAEAAVGRRIGGVHAPDAWYLKGGLTPATLRRDLSGRRIAAARRRGKLLLFDLDRGPTLGLRFGMTGRLYLDGRAAIERLEFGPGRRDPRWDRFALRLEPTGSLAVCDPRRLGGVELDPDEQALGVDALDVSPVELARALASSAPLKARLMDQRHLAGLGNLLTDELLWRASLAPGRPAASLDRRELRRLHHHLVRTLEVLGRRGGSHTGDLQAERRPGGRCPRDGAVLRRDRIGGRTTWWCPWHQALVSRG